MSRRLTPGPIYPTEPWHITEEGFNPATSYRNETIFALSNGYIGTRGTWEEGYDWPSGQGLEGTFLNGFYESEKIRYGEWNFGFPTSSQSLLNLPNLKTTRLAIDGEPFDLRTGTIHTCVRRLDLQRGCVTRQIEWSSPMGRRLRVETVRLVSLSRKHVMAQRLSVSPLNGGNLRVESLLDADVENHTREANPLVDYGPFGRHLEPVELAAQDDTLFYRGQTANSQLSMACGSRHRLTMAHEPMADQVESLIGEEFRRSPHAGDLAASVTYDMTCPPGATLTLDKFMVYASCLDHPADTLRDVVFDQLGQAFDLGFDELGAEQAGALADFWDMADICVDGDDAIQQGLRFNLFHIMQATTRDGLTGLGAKGLTGEGYEGHYFWDTEIYALPVFIHTVPQLARPLLDYRYRTLDEARARARVLGHHSGALYPWRTINGQEASTYLPLGTAQYHINADVAYAFSQYLQVSGDTDYLKQCAAEVLCETARVWADVGGFSEARDGKYCICCVTGPDEYTAFVDNNFYTNFMARENLRAAVRAVAWLHENDESAYLRLAAKIDLDPAEPVVWQQVADAMYLPYDPTRQVWLQDDGLLLRKPWDDSRIPPQMRHLLYENYHPLYLWRQRMLKQADGLLAMMLHPHLFATDEVRRNLDFYQELTLHHSSLSISVFGILASRVGDHETAAQYFAETARMDLDDHHDNVHAGIHAANMAGSWQGVVFGFAGVRTSGPQLEVNPYLPTTWTGYSFRLTYRGARLQVKVSRSGCVVTLENDRPVSLVLLGQTYHLTPEEESCHASL